MTKGLTKPYSLQWPEWVASLFSEWHSFARQRTILVVLPRPLSTTSVGKGKQEGKRKSSDLEEEEVGRGREGERRRRKREEGREAEKERERREEEEKSPGGPAYLELPGQMLLMALLHLLELGLQAFHLVLHLLHVLQVSLSPPVQDFYGLRHVLHLSRG